MDLVKFVTDIGQGVYDDHFDDIYAAIDNRRKALQRIASMKARVNLQAGDECIIQNCGTKYLNGARCRITRRNHGSKFDFTIEMLETRRRGRGVRYKGDSIKIVASCLKPVNSPVNP